MRVRAFLLLLLCAAPVAASEEVTVAVASNFKSTALQLANRFLDETGHAVRLSSGSTGKLYSQIVHGAPFDVFLAADAERPALLEESGLGVSESRFTYAVGSLVIYSRRIEDCKGALRDPDSGFVAIANPATSPYGAAAQQYLEAAGLWDQVSLRTVYGENITQTWQFAFTNNAPVAIVARAQLHAAPGDAACVVDVPPALHEALEQQAVLINDDNVAARDFMGFLRSDSAQEIMAANGYGVVR